MVVWVIAGIILVSGGASYAQEARESTVDEILTEAYSLIDLRPEDALKLLRRAQELQPRNIQIQKQIGYLYLAEKRYPEALSEFERIETVSPSDTIDLQIAYIHKTLGNRDAARTRFERLSSSSSPDVQSKAQTELASLSETDAERRWWTHVYAAPYFEARRFNNSSWDAVFVQAFGQHGYYLSPNHVVSAYGIAMLATDTRSKTGGSAPEIFSDNTLTLGVGLRVNPLTGLAIEAQAGPAFDLIDRGTGESSPRSDVRFVITYGNGFYAPYMYHEETLFPFHPFADVYASAGAYSRFKNNIGYLFLRGGVRVLEAQSTVADIYARLNFVRDLVNRSGHLYELNDLGPKEFYNNVNEWGIGLRVTPNVNWGLHVDMDFIRGRYTHELPRPADRSEYYNSYRLFLIFDRWF